MNQQKITEIQTNVRRILQELPSGVVLVAAAKTRSAEEVLCALDAGLTHIGHNYIQEAEGMFQKIGNRPHWHYIGHLQRNKVKTAVPIFDMIETVDSLRLAEKIDRECKAISKVMPILIEVNSGREESKNGVVPEDLDDLISRIAPLENIQVEGLMTMGPYYGNPEDARPFFRATKEAFDHIAGIKTPNVQMKWLSMGMSNSWKVAVEEGANIVRIGTLIFGQRFCTRKPDNIQ